MSLIGLPLRSIYLLSGIHLHHLERTWRSHEWRWFCNWLRMLWLGILWVHDGALQVVETRTLSLLWFLQLVTVISASQGRRNVVLEEVTIVLSRNRCTTLSKTIGSEGSDESMPRVNTPGVQSITTWIGSWWSCIFSKLSSPRGQIWTCKGFWVYEGRASNASRGMNRATRSVARYDGISHLTKTVMLRLDQ